SLRRALAPAPDRGGHRLQQPAGDAAAAAAAGGWLAPLPGGCPTTSQPPTYRVPTAAPAAPRPQKSNMSPMPSNRSPTPSPMPSATSPSPSPMPPASSPSPSPNPENISPMNIQSIGPKAPK